MTPRSLAAFACATLFALPASAADWAGIWTRNLDWCGNTEEIGFSETAPIRITPKEIHDLENFCEIATAMPLGVGQSWQLDLACSAEGYEYRDSQLMILNGAGELTLIGAGGFGITLKRCE